MQAKMGDVLEFNTPPVETVYVYEGETSDKSGSHVVSMEKKRPSWFPNKLLNKTG